jgi:hypothetical protein
MSNLQRRLKKLEALVTDDTGLVPGSPRWLAYWNERLNKFIAREDDAKDYKFPLEVIRAYIQTAEPAGVTGMSVGEEWDLNEQKSISAIGTTGTTYLRTNPKSGRSSIPMVRRHPAVSVSNGPRQAAATAIGGPWRRDNGGETCTAPHQN